ncbi:MAG: alanine racemase C-terminal domain-containing protein [Actinomycetota bacterium]
MLHSVRIDLDAVRANARTLATHGDFVADVSFDGWGHGAVGSAHAAVEGGASALAIDSDAEEAELVAAGFTVPILRTAVHPGRLYGLLDGYVPAMLVTSEIVGLKPVTAGDGVSYGYTFRASKPSTLGLVGIGYADGLDRAAGNIGSLVVRGRERPIVGRVAMNVVMVDLGDDVVPVGESVEVFGRTRRAAVWAESIGRRAEEVVLEFGARQ